MKTGKVDEAYEPDTKNIIKLNYSRDYFIVIFQFSRFVGSFSESPVNSVFQRSSDFNGFFNWTLGYRRDSDLTYDYGKVYPKNPQHSLGYKKFDKDNFDIAR